MNRGPGKYKIECRFCGHIHFGRKSCFYCSTECCIRDMKLKNRDRHLSTVSKSEKA